MTTGSANVEELAHATANEPSIEDCKEQVRRIVHSTTFRNAATLQQLLQFLADKTLDPNKTVGSAESLKEYTIGVEALGRKPDFDPKVDPIVRVQSHRLRGKLKEYYEDEGARDPILIQFPKGHYVPTFDLMAHLVLSHPVPGDPFHQPETTAFIPEVDLAGKQEQKTHSGTGLSKWWMVLAMAVFSAFLGAFGYWLGSTRAEKQSVSNAAVEPNSSAANNEVDSFWWRFLAGDTSPLIAYTDAVFLLDDSNDLFRFRHGAIDNRGSLVDPHLAREFASNPDIVAHAGNLYYENGYTGTGELESIAMLSAVFGRMGLKPIIKSSRDVTPDDLNRHNVILLGSPFQNAAVAQLLTAGDFSYSNPNQHLEQWRAQILDAHPRPGEAATYRTERDAASKVLTGDFSLITIAPSVTPGRSIAIIGGLDTKGTEGAMMFATSQYGVSRLNKALEGFGGNKKDLLPFQALVHVRLAKGYQVLGVELISMHTIPAAKP